MAKICNRVDDILLNFENKSSIPVISRIAKSSPMSACTGGGPVSEENIMSIVKDYMKALIFHTHA